MGSKEFQSTLLPFIQRIVERNKRPRPVLTWISATPPTGAPHFQLGDMREILQVMVHGRQVTLVFEDASGKLESEIMDYSQLDRAVLNIIPHNIRKKIVKIPIS